MRTCRRTDTAATPASLLPETLTIKPIVQAPSKKTRGSKTKKKCVTGFWDLKIPSELLQDILSRLGPKANIQASVVCKAWFEAAVSVRKFLPLPWAFYPLSQDGDYILFDPSTSQTHKHNCPDLKGHEALSGSRDGWLLVATRIATSNNSSSKRPLQRQLVVWWSPSHKKSKRLSFVISTWRPGETVWTNHRYENRCTGVWENCVFSNGVFYALSKCAVLGIFDPCKATWDVLQVKSWPNCDYCQIELFLMEHGGNIFVLSTRRYTYDQKSVFKLNLEGMIWEEKSEICGMTVLARYIELGVVSLQRSCCLSAKERNGRCPSTNELASLYYSLFGEKNSRPPTSTSFSNRIAWVDPPHNNVNFWEIMITGRRTYTAATPASLLPETLTIKPNGQAPSKKARGNHGSKKKKKCVTGSWDLNIPTELLQEILSRLGPKDNIHASVVCKTWFEAAVSVRRFQPLPWLFYPSEEDGDYILFNPSRSQKYKQNSPELKGQELISYSRDGWLLVVEDKHSKSGFFLNPFTREHISLPNRPPFFSGHCLAFSAAPTSTSCLVASFTQKRKRHLVIATWRPGETKWTIHRYPTTSSSGRWNKCVFSNGVFYALSDCGFLGVFDPCKATWNVRPVKPWDCAAFCDIDFSRSVLLMEHDGNIFVMSGERGNNNRSVFKLNQERMVWEEKSEEVCGLTVFATYAASITGSCSYPSTNGLLSVYYSLVDDKSSRSPTTTSLPHRVAWVDPPHDNVNL
ncbi:unnamed protein product [Thlaspi arvense]|uniref:F-box domain-containing protein n=1 Tax=Thlaspi arvense TaxID=13288 RepID=A0AAU9RZY6_THLAR|nr:unnamed protein product [Thlaspi arvense]